MKQERNIIWRGSFTYALSVLAGTLAFAGPAPALTTDTFDEFAAGTIITNQYSGVSISLLDSAPIAGPITYALQDTNGVPQFIFGASGNAITPGDNVGQINPPFYDMQFAFSQPIDYFSLMALDAEESVSATAYLGNTFVQSIDQGNFIGFHSASVFNGPVYSLDLGSVGGSLLFDRVVITLDQGGGPEVYDNLVFDSVNAVPEPEVYAMLAAGLGLLGFVTRYRKKKAA